MTKDGDGPRGFVPPQGPKMSMQQQAEFLSGLLLRCVMHGKDAARVYAGEALLSLSGDDMLRLTTIRDTLDMMAQYRADVILRDQIAARYARRRGGGG